LLVIDSELRLVVNRNIGRSPSSSKAHGQPLVAARWTRFAGVMSGWNAWSAGADRGEPAVREEQAALGALLDLPSSEKG
jgi:hypothetical protein